jgi:magnesium-transporting ATPase (P-type)
MTKNRLWLRWTGANAFGEMFGLGLTFAITGWFFSSQANPGTTAGILMAFAVAVLSGVVEATMVGLAQWWAMHPWFPSIKRFSWWLATLVGALIAYVLGYLPSTLMDMGTSASQTAAPVEPPQWIVLLLAAGMGAVGGAVLSFAQWLVLRGKVKRAGLWIPANMLAWIFGMPLIFWGIDLAFKMSAVWQSVLLMAGVLFITGAIVGAIEGAFLVRMVDDVPLPSKADARD